MIDFKIAIFIMRYFTYQQKVNVQVGEMNQPMNVLMNLLILGT